MSSMTDGVGEIRKCKIERSKCKTRVERSYFMW